MQAHKVKLPSDPLIPYLKFCRLIADAIHPINKDIKGIKCVMSKVYHSEAPSLGFGIGLPYALDDKDLKSLAKLLPKLPPLSYGMSEADIDLFMQAYESLPERPLWMPLIASEKTVSAEKIKHRQAMDLHIELVRKERVAGRLVPLNNIHVALDAVQLDAHISRQDAIAYLKRHGLEYEDEIAKSQEQNILSNKTVHQAGDVDPTALIARKSQVGAKRFSDAQKEDAVKRSNQLEGVVNDFVQKVAEEYGVNVRTIDNWRRAAKKAKEEAKKLRRFQGFSGE